MRTMSDEWPICDWFLDRVADMFEQFMAFHPRDARKRQLSREIFYDLVTHPDFERNLTWLASAQGQQIADNLRSRLVSFKEKLRDWEVMKDENEQQIIGIYEDDLYDPAFRLSIYLRNLS